MFPYINTKYRTHRVSCDQKYVFAGSLQPSDAQDDSNMQSLSYSARSIVPCVDLRVLLLVFANKITQPTRLIFKLHSNIMFT